MNIKDIPRTIDAVRNLPTNIRYRIAMQVGAIPSDKDAIAALATRPLDEQANIILTKLLEIDAAGGQLPQAPPPAAQVIRNPDPVPHQVVQVQQPVYPMQQPQQLGAPTGYAPPQQIGGANTVQMPLQHATQPLRTPATQQDPGANGASQAAVAASSLMNLSSQIGKVLDKIDTEVPGFEELEELKDAVMGIATSVNTLVIIGLLILERVNDDMLPRSVIYDMIREQLAARTSEQLMGALRSPVQGK